MPDISPIEPFKGRWILDDGKSDSCDKVFETAGVNFVKRKMITAVVMDLEFPAEVEGEKAFLREKLFSSFVNVDNKLPLSLNNEEATEWCTYDDSAFGMKLAKAAKYDPETKKLVIYGGCPDSDFKITDTMELTFNYGKPQLNYTTEVTDGKGKEAKIQRYFKLK